MSTVSLTRRASRSTRIGGLDGLRGLSVLLVVAFHVSGSALPHGGAVGVTTFFVLSGFLITSLLVCEREKNGRIDLRAFYIRRVLRLYPALLAFLLVLPVVMWAAGDPNLGAYSGQALLAGLYLSDFASVLGFGMGILTHTWSLAVEEQFYLLWPALLILLLVWSRGDRSKLLRLVAGVFVVALGWRIGAQLTLDSIRVYYAPDTNFFAMLGGAVLGTVRQLPRMPRWAGSTALAALVVLAVSRPLSADAATFGGWVITASALTALAVVWAASQGGIVGLELIPLRWFGGISYGLYLWHDALLKLRIDDDEFQGVERVIVAAAAVVLAWASFRLVERPALRLKKRFERSTIG